MILYTWSYLGSLFINFKNIDIFLKSHKKQGFIFKFPNFPFCLLADFKKQQLRVQINVLRSLKISGERHLDERRRSRFRKEIRISQDCNADEIRAKFGRGILSIIMPKKTPSRSTQRNGKPGGEIDQSLVWRLRINRKTAVKVAAALVVIVAFGNYLAYRY